MSFIPTCPSCSALLQFTSDNTNLIVCRCGTVVFRNALDLRAVNTIKVIHSADTILQPGTGGTWSGKNFSLAGRCRLWIEDVTLNVWTMIFNDGTTGLLTEGYGEYIVLQQPVLTDPAIPDGLQVGHSRSFGNNTQCWLNKRLDVNSWDFEGEILMPALVDHPVIYEYDSKTGLYWRWNNGMRTNDYKAVSTNFAELRFTNLREKNSIGSTVNCPRCNTSIELKNYPQTQSCVCPSCEQWIAFDEKRSPVSAQPKKNGCDIAPLLKLGSRGKLKGIEYEVMGYAVKCQTDFVAYWIEYTLYNAAEGYAFLSEYNGHWIYLRERSHAPFVKQAVTTLDWKGEPFKLFNDYYALVVKAGGEFPGNIFNKADTRIHEFISPPEMWVREQELHKNITWFFATNMPVTELMQGWPDVPMPAQNGMGTLQGKGYVSPAKLISFSFVLLLLLALLHLAINQTKSHRELLNQTVILDSAKKGTVHIPRFYLDKWRSNIELRFSAGISNSWLELSGTLTNTDNGKEYTFEEGLEYYSGVSDGERWTEGDWKKSVDLMGIPRGNYIMEIEGTAEASPAVNDVLLNIEGATQRNTIDSFQLIITYDTALNSNYWIFAGLFVVIPAIMGIRLFTIEKNRWSESPFNPYTSE